MDYGVGAEAAFKQGRRMGLEEHQIDFARQGRGRNTGRSWDEERA